MLIIGIDPGISGSICFFENGKIIDVIENEKKYNYKVVKHIIKYKDLPKNFDGYKITHISDFHD